MKTRSLLTVAAVCLSGLLVWTFLLARQLDEVSHELVDTTAYIAQMSSELATTRADGDLLVAALGVLEADGLRQIELQGPAQARGRAFVSARGLILLVEGLESLRAGGVYQVWVGQGDTVEAAGTFEVNPFGMATAVFSHRAAAGSAVVTITPEPAGGSRAPTSGPVLTGS